MQLKHKSIKQPNKQQTWSGTKNLIPQTQEKKKDEPTTAGAIYARVSSNKQKDDLERQIKNLQTKYPSYKVYRDICSGLKYKRKGLERLLDDTQKGIVKEIVVAHKDRLARFGTELIEWIINKAGSNLIIESQDHLTPQEELTQDLMAIVHVFSCRFNGKRRYSTKQTGEKNKKRRLQGNDCIGTENVKDAI